MRPISYPWQRCPICEGARVSTGSNTPTDGSRELNCPNCGEHFLSRDAIAGLPELIGKGIDGARLSFALRKLEEGSLLTLQRLTDLLEATELPGAIERLDNLVLFLAKTPPGHRQTLRSADLRATIGAEFESSAEWVLLEAVADGLLLTDDPNALKTGNRQVPGATLSLKGWRRREELLRLGAGSRHAFMAMAFQPEMWALLHDHLKPTVQQTGFELRPLAGAHQTAGSIDNRMRVEIRTSRFMVCDLTHNNRGAYWEAGFAEGLGRPIFYTCRRDVLNSTDPAVKPHFDTAHQLITTWSPDTIDNDMRELKAVIRNTLPAEATMQDAAGQADRG